MVTAGAKPEALAKKPGESQEDYEYRLQINAKMRFHRSLNSTLGLNSNIWGPENTVL